MREIKFEVIENNKRVAVEFTQQSYNGGWWSHYSLLKPEEDAVIEDGCYKNHGLETVIRRQYIGLKDCKRTAEYLEGQNIYEGDIVKVQVNWLSKETDIIEEHDVFIGQVLFSNFEWILNGITFADNGEKLETRSLNFTEYRIGYSWGNGIEEWHGTFTAKERFTEFEVIGNIYENPELLEK